MTEVVRGDQQGVFPIVLDGECVLRVLFVLDDTCGTNNSNHMHWLDITLVIFVGCGAYYGFRRGFSSEFVSVFLVAIFYLNGVGIYHQLLELLNKKYPMYHTLWSISLLVGLLVIGSCLVIVLTKLVKSILHITFLGIFDSIVGAIWGAFKVVGLIVLVFYSCKLMHVPICDIHTMDRSICLMFLNKWLG